MAQARAAQTRLLCGDDDADVEVTLRELFELLHRRGTRQFESSAFEMAAIVLGRRGDVRRAARYLGVSAGIRAARGEEYGEVRLLVDLADAAREQAMTAMGTSEYTDAEAAGRRLPSRDAVTEVLGELGGYQRRPGP